MSLIGETAKAFVQSQLGTQLGVLGIFLLDSSSITLPNGACDIFPAPRNNIRPAGIKLHFLSDLLTGNIPWFDMSPATSHDSQNVPPLEILRGALLIFDLGYYGFSFFKDLAEAGVHYLCRVKQNAKIRVVGISAKSCRRSCLGKLLSEVRLPKGKLIEILGEFQCEPGEVLETRVIGFWNPIDNIYHWYMTDLAVSAKLIYPLYRIRWQLELIFKASKSSLRLKDIPSANQNIIKNLIMISLVSHLLSQPIARVLCLNIPDDIQLGRSVQRSAMMFVHLASEFREFILGKGNSGIKILVEKLQQFIPELFDPNYRSRKTSLQRLEIMLENKV